MTQSDVRAVQLAKGALRTGIDLLSRQNYIERSSKTLLAGAFGSYIKNADVLDIGIFPKMPDEDIEVVGNAAGAGAIFALCDDAYFRASKDLAKRTKVFELASHTDFENTIIEHLSF